MNPEQVQAFLNWNDIISMILAIVALIVTVIGFFASLKFYRDGVELQKSANNALTKIEEKASSIQTQVGGMFDKVLDAAIIRKEQLSENLDSITAQLENAKQEIVKEASSQIGKVSDEQVQKLLNIVNDNLSRVRTSVITAKESVESVSETINSSRSPTDRALDILARSDWLTSVELARFMGVSIPTIRMILFSLLERDLIEAKRDGNSMLYKSKNLGTER